MSYIVKFSPLALADLDRVYYEVFQACLDNNTTRKYVSELIDKIENKKEFPESGTPLNFNNIFTGYRFVIYKSYIAFYYIDSNTIYVDRVLYSKSDYIKKLNLVNIL